MNSLIPFRSVPLGRIELRHDLVKPRHTLPNLAALRCAPESYVQVLVTNTPQRLSRNGCVVNGQMAKASNK